MKLIILRNNLKEGLSSIEHAVHESGNLPILKNALLEARDHALVISATNLEISIQRTVTGKIVREGRAAIPFGTLYSIISNADSERINLEGDGNHIIVSTDNYQAKIQGMNAADFPAIPRIAADAPLLEISGATLSEAIADVIGAAHISEIRPEISGVLFDFQVTTLTLAATDSFRLAEKKLTNRDFKGQSDQGATVILPLKSAHEIMRVFPNDAPIGVYIDAHQILLKTPTHEFLSRLISGTYPDYKEIIPKKSESELVVNREKLMNAVRLASNFSGKVNEVRLKAPGEAKTLEVYSASQELGENRYLVPAKAKGVPFEEVKFNWRYLLDGLKAVRGEEVLLSVSGDAKPALMRAPEEANYFYILMPIKSS